MKSFFQFLTETESRAKEQARKLGLKSDGHGGWLDRSGEFVAKTEGQKLKFFNKNQRPGRDPDQTPGRKAHLPVNAKKMARSPEAIEAKRRKDDDLAGAPLQKKPEEEGKKGEGQTLTTAFGRFNPPTTGHEKLLGAARKAAAGGALKIYQSGMMRKDTTLSLLYLLFQHPIQITNLTFLNQITYYISKKHLSN